MRYLSCTRDAHCNNVHTTCIPRSHTSTWEASWPSETQQRGAPGLRSPDTRDSRGHSRAALGTARSDTAAILARRPRNSRGGPNGARPRREAGSSQPLPAEGSPKPGATAPQPAAAREGQNGAASALRARSRPPGGAAALPQRRSGPRRPPRASGSGVAAPPRPGRALQDRGLPAVARGSVCRTGSGVLSNRCHQRA